MFAIDVLDCPACGGPYAQLAWAHPPVSFTPVFWNLQMFPKWKEQTLGLLCDPRHPAFQHFPTESYSEWNWADVLYRSRAVVLDGLPRDLRPLVQVIDDWNRNRRLALLFECKVGSGSLLICSADLPRLVEPHVSARQLYRSLLDYAGSDRFKPGVRLTVNQVGSLLMDTDLMKRLGARVFTPSATDQAQKPGEIYLREDAVAVRAGAGRPLENLLDGDPGTSWLTAGAKGFPHEVVVELPKPVRIAGIRCLPTQDSYDGAIRDYAVLVSEDSKSWREAARGVFNLNLDERQVRFTQPQTARAFKLIALSGYGDRPLASLSIIEAK